MSLDVIPTWFPRPSTTSRTRSAMTTDRDFRDAPIYITGFPGFDQIQNSSSNFNKFQMESSDTHSSALHQVRLDLHEYQGTTDIDALVDQLQLREDHHDTHATRRNQLNPLSNLKKSEKKPTSSELDTLFISMFHTQFCKIDKKHINTPFEDNIQRFFLMYTRRWEETSDLSRSEKQCISDFKKKHHDKLNKDEWNHFCNYVKKTNFNSSHKGFSEFCSLLKNRTPTSSPPSPLGSSPSSPNDSSTPSWLSKTLLSMNSTAMEVNFSIEELKRLYLCVYFPNYQELWDSDKFVLSGSLVQSIESFVESNPDIDPEIMSALLANMK